MIRIYGTAICPYCAYLKDQIKGNADFEKIDICEKTSNLKEFLKLRDKNPAFDSIRGTGKIGIPCFLLPNGEEGIFMSPFIKKQEFKDIK